MKVFGGERGKVEVEWEIGIVGSEEKEGVRVWMGLCYGVWNMELEGFWICFLWRYAWVL
ncbi:hypothetical protein [Paenibacillus xylanexedens]|uniref:hypothetical protein n=1 Tax=Paenibacillus xylanexedens TaxID=528191 RepID=UPI00164273B4|nr:hypothetical protein [Paenibacillus xylanexedens]